jgi:hypothetical protein
MFLVDGLNGRDNGEGNADQIGRRDGDGPPLLQMRNDIGDEIK